MSMEKTYAYEVEKIFTSWYSSLCYFAFRYVQDDETARAFFVWIMLCTIPSFWATHLVRKNLTDNHSDNSSR